MNSPAEPAQAAAAFDALTRGIPLDGPTTALAWQAVVDIGPTESLGRSPLGERFIVPILGGRFEGEIGGLALRGEVVPGGADRQLVRADGIKELDAFYEMRTDDGVVLTIRNRVLIDAQPDQPRRAFSQVQVTAPEGRYALLNRQVFVGTLHPLRPARDAVLVRVWRLNPA
jgi:hypothetical protein